MADESGRTEVGRLLFEVEKIMRQYMRKNLEPSGLTMPQGAVIGILMENGGEMKITDLSSRLNLSNSTVSGIVDRLEKQQLVIRRRSEEDRRRVYVNVSQKFMEIHKETIKKIEGVFENMLRNGTQQEIVRIIDGLSTLKKIITECNNSA